MTVSFPPSPSVNDTYAYNGTTYVFDGVKWVSGGATAYVLVGNETVRSVNAQIGNVVLNSADVGAVPATGGTFSGNVVTTGDIQSTSQNGGPLAGFRNQLINGDFRIWQRGTSFAADTAQYIADRWYVPAQNGAVILDTSTQAPNSHSWSLRIATGQQRSRISQGVELLGTGWAGVWAPGTTWTVSYWAKVSGGTAVVGTALDFADTVANDANKVAVSTSGFTHNITTTWTRFTHTFTIAAGVKPANTNKCFRLTLVNENPVLGNLYLSEFQIEPGPVATPFEHRPYAAELALCQRYCQKIGILGSIFNAHSQGSSSYIKCSSPVSMRANPTVNITSVSASAGRMLTSGASTAFNVVGASFNETNSSLRVTPLATTNSFAPYTVGPTNTITLEAEL